MGTIHNNAVGRAKAAQAKVETDATAYSAASAKLTTLSGRKSKLDVTVAELEKNAAKNPKKYGAALKAAKAKQAEVGKAFDAAAKDLKAAAAALGADSKELQSAKEAALEAAKQEKVPAAYWLDSADDAGSLSSAKQKQILGVDSGVSPAKALARDVKTVQDAVKSLPPAEALKVLDKTLMGTDPTRQKQLLESLKPELARLAAASVKSNRDAGAVETAGNYLEAMRTIAPDAREVMVGALASAVPSGKDWKSGISHMGQTALGEALSKTLKRNFETAGVLTTALMKSGKLEQASGVRFLVAEQARALRGTFEAKEKTVQKLRGELALLNQGVGSLMDEGQRLKAISAFKAEHKDEFEAFDKAAGEYAEVLKALTNDTGPMQDGRFAYNDNKAFEKEMELAKKHLPSINSTPEGEKVILTALEEQAKGLGPKWLQEVADVTKNTKAVADGTANVIAMGIAQLGARGSLTKKFEVYNLLDANKHLLGIDKAAVDKLSDAFSSIDGSEVSNQKVKKAFDELGSGGAYGKSPVTHNALKLIGIGLSAYGLARGLKDWKQGDALTKVKTIVDGANLGVEGSRYALELFGKKGVADTLGRFGGGGLGVISGVLDGYSAYQQFKEGNIGAGVGTSMSAAGSLLMGAATLSESIPGGQLIGAGLALAGLVTNLVVGSREKGKQERASEKDALAYLLGGGVDAAVAKPLSNVREDDHRNAGIPIRQIAERLGMKGDELFQKLQKLPPAKVDEFVKRMLMLELNDDGTVRTGRARGVEEIDSPVVKEEHTFSTATSDNLITIKYGPRTLGTATEWAKAWLAQNGIK